MSDDVQVKFDENAAKFINEFSTYKVAVDYDFKIRATNARMTFT